MIASTAALMAWGTRGHRDRTFAKSSDILVAMWSGASAPSTQVCVLSSLAFPDEEILVLLVQVRILAG